MELIARSLSRLETLLAELRNLVRPEQIEQDPVVERFVMHTMELMVNRALDIAEAVSSGGGPAKNRSDRELFGVLVRGGWTSKEVARELTRMAGFCEMLAHDTEAVSPGGVRESLDRWLPVMATFAEEVRHRLPGGDDLTA
jgi:uncharacterized protein YutE (UPF0331/DUF86 family)